jgi:hypothetical protein
MKNTFAAKTFAAYAFRSGTWTGAAPVPIPASFRGMVFQSGAAAGQPFSSGTMKAQLFHNGAEAGTTHG